MDDPDRLWNFDESCPFPPLSNPSFPPSHSPSSHYLVQATISLFLAFTLLATKQIAALEEVLTTVDVKPHIVQAVKAKNLTGTFFVSASGPPPLPPPPLTLTGKTIAPVWIVADTKLRRQLVWADQEAIKRDPIANEARFTVQPKGWTDKDICKSTVEYFIDQVPSLPFTSPSPAHLSRSTRSARAALTGWCSSLTATLLAPTRR